MEIILIVAAILAALIAKGIYDRKKYEKKLWKEATESFGREPRKDITNARAMAISYYSEHKDKSACYIDDTTWEDIDMPRIYGRLNSCKCAVGEEYLYHLLRNPSCDEKELKERERVISHLQNDDKHRKELAMGLLKIGSLKNISAYEYINRLGSIEPDNTAIHLFQALLLIAFTLFL